MPLYDGHSIADADGNANGRLDPGETVALDVVLRNFGAEATNVSATLTSGDANVEIVQGTAGYGTLAEGTVAGASGQPFRVAAPAGAPLGHVTTLTVEVSYDGGSQVSTFPITIGQYHYLVWDPSPDHSGGPPLAATLATLGYNGHSLEELPATRLADYRTLFVTVGIYASNYIIGVGSTEALAIEDFLAAGGCAYLEGADVWYYDPGIGGHDFQSAFGIQAVSDGSSDCGPVEGVAGTFSEGMSFAYVGENSYIDHLAAAAGATLVLRNGSPVYGLGIAYDAGNYRTFGASFEFAGLADGAPPSTKLALMEGIMDFFLDASTGAGETPAAGAALASYPNPFNPTTTLRFRLPEAGPARLTIHDAAGRLVRVLADGPLAAGEHARTWDGRDASGRPLASGLYLARLRAPGVEQGRKLVLLK
ncbi:MAG: T9SS type A sorting domain-containing protein [Candidatus Krumholzibacteriota bacterium]|nr:T9SS type A sorting domain-containing protein [Candidatus Krumholzibacteriota bacterium]